MMDGGYLKGLLPPPPPPPLPSTDCGWVPVIELAVVGRLYAVYYMGKIYCFDDSGRPFSLTTFRLDSLCAYFKIFIF